MLSKGEKRPSGPGQDLLNHAALAKAGQPIVTRPKKTTQKPPCTATCCHTAFSNTPGTMVSSVASIHYFENWIFGAGCYRLAKQGRAISNTCIWPAKSGQGHAACIQQSVHLKHMRLASYGRSHAACTEQSRCVIPTLNQSGA